jgi:subtilase family serine protease
MKRLSLTCASLFASAILAAPATGAASAALPTAIARPFMAQPVMMKHLAHDQLPSLAECLQFILNNGFPLTCMGPTEFRNAYDLGPLFNAGIDGHGRTIVIVDSFGSPTIQDDLAVFDQQFGLPAPPSFRIICPSGPDGTDPNAGCTENFPFDDGQALSWAYETTLDVEVAHEMAPGANILLVTTPVSETAGVQGFPEMMAAENYVVNNNLGDVISQSFGAPEETFPTTASLLNLRSAYKNAARHQVSVLASTGDLGASGGLPDLSCCYPTRVASWPASDPLVTAVGGTRIHLDGNGNRTQPDDVWNDYGASGGGPSHVFSRPDYQNNVAKVVGQQRGMPDISMAAYCFGPWLYENFDPNPDFRGWLLACGTSESSPLFAGIVALADQAAGKRLGMLNERLYPLLHQKNSGLVDVTSGNNTWIFCSVNCGTDQEVDTTVQGFNALPGYDMASGLGTVDATLLVKALASSS